MKIRTGFVSNSSSSSFLIFYKNDDSKYHGFGRFSNFKGFDRFLNDFNKVKEFDEDTIEFLCQEIHEYFYELSKSPIFTSLDEKIEFNLMFRLLDISKIKIWEDDNSKGKYYSSGKFSELTHEFSKKKDIFWRELKEKDPNIFNLASNIRYYCSENFDFDSVIQSIISDNKSAKDNWNSCIEKYKKEVDDMIWNKKFELKIKKIVKEIYETFKDDGYSIKCLRYGNEINSNEDETYMEWSFMPFLVNDPEKRFIVIPKSEH